MYILIGRSFAYMLKGGVIIVMFCFSCAFDILNDDDNTQEYLMRFKKEFLNKTCLLYAVGYNHSVKGKYNSVIVNTMINNLSNYSNDIQKEILTEFFYNIGKDIEIK